MPKCSSSPPPSPTPFTLLSKICMHLLQRRTVKMLQFYITTSFCVVIDHFNAICRKLFLYMIYIYIFFYFLLYILPTQLYKCCCCFFFYIFTSCVVTYPPVRKHHLRQHLIWNFHENHIPFSHFLPIQIPEWICLGDNENHYETWLWCAVDFNNLKFISSSTVDASEITCSCIFFF